MLNTMPSAPVRILSLAAVALAALALAGCATTTAEPTTAPTTEPAAVTTEACAGDEGITLIVDAQSIDAGSPEAWCVPATEPVIAADVLAIAGVETEGTTEYPELIVCRVDGVPAEETDLVGADGTVVNEACESMPPAFAYWSLWVKPAGGEWEYAMEGLATQELVPGDSVELLFQLNGEPLTP